MGLSAQAFIPLLGAHRTLLGDPGRIIQISSVFGKIGFPLMSGYCASKHALEGFSEGMRRELMLYGIDVIIVGQPILDEMSTIQLYRIML